MIKRWVHLSSTILPLPDHLRGKEIGFVPMVVGAALLLDVALVRLLFRASSNSVWFLGRELTYRCEFKRLTGLPCPTCGVTRGFILSLSGNLRDGWHLNPLGPLLAWGLVSAGLIFVVLGVARQFCSEGIFTQLVASTRKSLLAYSSITCLIWLTSWVYALAEAIKAK